MNAVGTIRIAYFNLFNTKLKLREKNLFLFCPLNFGCNFEW